MELVTQIIGEKTIIAPADGQATIITDLYEIGDKWKEYLQILSNFLNCGCSVSFVFLKDFDEVKAEKKGKAFIKQVKMCLSNTFEFKVDYELINDDHKQSFEVKITPVSV